jgi:hypothetical protein
MISRLFVLCFMLYGSQASHAESQITGAFGFDLGEKYVGPSSTNIILDYPVTLHKVKPRSPISLLDDYYIVKTRDNRIASILGVQMNTSCNQEYTGLIAALSKKYKNLATEDLSDGDQYVTDFNEDGYSRYIRVACELSWFGDLVYVDYTDMDLYKIVQNEELGNLDTDAL